MGVVVQGEEERAREDITMVRESWKSNLLLLAMGEKGESLEDYGSANGGWVGHGVGQETQECRRVRVQQWSPRGREVKVISTTSQG